MLISRSDRGLIARWWFTVDRALLSAVTLLIAAGVLFSMAASPPVAARLGLPNFHFFDRQLMYVLPALLVMIGTSMLDLKSARRVSLAVFILGIGLMLAAITIGPEIKGAHRWIDIGPINLQPSEIVKPAFVVMAAWFLAEASRKADVPGMPIAWAFYLLFVGLLVKQPDFGQTALVSAVFIAMLLAYGIPWILIGGLGATGIGLAFVAYESIPYVRSRVMRFLDPDKGDNFQIETATDAFRNGGLFGTGPGGGTAKQILPDAHTDFIAAVIGEEFGFVALVLLIGVFAFIVLRVLRKAERESDAFASLAMTGLVTMLGLQASINLAVNASLMPAKGMTLPFVSYGGSSLVATAFAMGLVLAVSRRRPQAKVVIGPLAQPGIAH
ncbi:MAG: putative lipid II flippase FtsW [Hyphomicrobiales bacterium]